MRSTRELVHDARMYGSRLLNRSLAPPDWLSINLTLRCNLSCVMCTTCYDAPELSRGEVIDLVDQAASWGVKVFNPLGGEPFIRQDLEDILAHAARRDLYTTLTTNGTLITAARAARIAAIPTEKLHINVSIDGLQETHDGVRGKGTFQRTIAGYRRLREADAAAGNPRRKICANSILHAKNLDEYLDLVALLEEEGFSGLQVLHLFRSDEDSDVGGMWFAPEQLPKLEAVCAALGEHPLVMNRHALPLVPRYYRDGLGPLEAPCWAGWKELYVNADGSVIMCDGKLDFLAGRFGSVRELTLRELWRSPALRERRAVVKTCTTPCIQGCYLRTESDSATRIAKGLVENVTAPLRAKVARALPARTVEGTLTLELSDTPDDPAHLRTRALFATSPVPIDACFAAPDRLLELRDRRYLDFGRGFLGADVVAHVRDGLREARLRFRTVSLTWRGEPLLHPEFPVVWDALDGIADQVRVVTSGLLLRDEHVRLLGRAEVWIDPVRSAFANGAYADLLTTRAAAVGARRGAPRPDVIAPALSWDGHLTVSVEDTTLSRQIGDVLKEPMRTIWARFPA
ncbi:MAG: radical SAM protein [Pseudomonadota bacterium]|nr:radical SAM protein [Pseudomonadota bacterium]